ncbi:MAG: M23 family metallopeptidase [Acidobacteria bacterium]|nr:M23 family metallopeptidase [Acidobacteriota bacterium]
MFKKFFSSLRLRNSWNYKNHRWVLFVNVGCALLALSGAISHYRSRAGEVTPREALVNHPAPLPAKTLIERFEGHIQKNMTLGDVLTAYNLPQEMVHQLVAVTKPIYNLKKLIVGNRFELEKLPDGTLKMFSYAVDLDRYVEVSLTDQGYKAEMKPFEYETHRELISGTIRSSLFQTMSEMNEGDELALEMAETFSYDIDFNTELQPGDHFKLAVEKQHRDGEFVKYGRILAAEFSNKGKVYSAFRFTDPEGRSEFYDARGRALKRDLLKSPLKFSRVSSRFSRRRFHPVLGVFRPHLGVDYSAPTGTPVYAAGSGRAAFIGWKNGFGKFIQIHHGSEYSTMYGHLSRFAAGLQTGDKVQQGQLIGYVGATGLATGPHLDYRITRKGAFINPLGLKFQPSAPLRPEYLLAFEVKKQEWQGELARLDFAKSPQQAFAVKVPTSTELDTLLQGQ